MNDHPQEEAGYSDKTCVKKAQQGDAEAFSILVDRYASRLFSTCFSFMGNKQDAEDCVQEALIKAYRSLTSYSFKAAFYTWLYRIAVNTCLDYHRKHSRWTVYSIDETIDTGENKIQAQYADDQPLPDEEVEKRELQILIREAIADLPAKMRQIVVLRDLEGMPYKELAELLDISEGTVKSRLSRARQQLMKKIISREHPLVEQTISQSRQKNKANDTGKEFADR